MKRGLFFWCSHCGNWADLKQNGKPGVYECSCCKAKKVIPQEDYLREVKRQGGFSPGYSELRP